MRLFVGGIPYSTDSDDLRRLFEQAGQVTEAAVVEDRYSGQSKGFGFVEMPQTSEAETAIARFNGHSLDGRPLTVNEAKPRENRGGYGGNRNGRSVGTGRRW